MIGEKRKENRVAQGINQIQSEERRWEPMIYLVLAFAGAFFLYNPYVQ